MKKIYHAVKKQSETNNTLVRAFIASKQKRPMSTASERAHHQEKFKNDSITRYNAQSPTSNDYIMCCVMGCYIRHDEVIAGHICGLQEQDALPVLGKDFSFKWDPKNCLLMFKPLKKL